MTDALTLWNSILPLVALCGSVVLLPGWFAGKGNLSPKVLARAVAKAGQNRRFAGEDVGGAGGDEEVIAEAVEVADEAVGDLNIGFIRERDESPFGAADVRPAL